jgi:hypothetical protein
MINQSIINIFQIYQEAKKFGKIYNINVVCAYGGGSMWEQTKACQEGAEIIVATPVRGDNSLTVDFQFFFMIVILASSSGTSTDSIGKNSGKIEQIGNFLCIGK